VVVDVGTAVFQAASLADGARDLVVIDAVCAGDAPGTVYTFDGYAAEESGRFRSLHSLGLRSALHLLPAGHRPSTFQVVGVEPESLAYGMELTPRVQAALPRVIDEVRHAVQQTK
jgi:hydrogenase maturation protease